MKSLIEEFITTQQNTIKNIVQVAPILNATLDKIRSDLNISENDFNRLSSTLATLTEHNLLSKVNSKLTKINEKMLLGLMLTHNSGKLNEIIKTDPIVKSVFNGFLSGNNYVEALENSIIALKLHNDTLTNIEIKNAQFNANEPYIKGSSEEDGIEAFSQFALIRKADCIEFLLIYGPNTVSEETLHDVMNVHDIYITGNIVNDITSINLKLTTVQLQASNEIEVEVSKKRSTEVFKIEMTDSSK